KTGTLTRGEHVVTEVATVDGVATEDLLRWAGAVEADSEHPLARAIHAHAREHAGAVPAAQGFGSMTGRGVAAAVDATPVAVGRPALLRERDAEVPAALADRTRAWGERGAAVLHVLRDGEVVGALGLEDEVREVSREAVAELHD